MAQNAEDQAGPSVVVIHFGDEEAPESESGTKFANTDKKSADDRNPEERANLFSYLFFT